MLANPTPRWDTCSSAPHRKGPDIEAVTEPSIYRTYTILTLVDGILNIVFGSLGVAFLFCTTIVCAPLGVYPIVLGILELVQYGNLKKKPPVQPEIPVWLCVMQIIGVVFSNPLAMGTGIVGLIANNDASVKAYLQQGVAQQQYTDQQQY